MYRQEETRRRRKKISRKIYARKKEGKLIDRMRKKKGNDYSWELSLSITRRDIRTLRDEEGKRYYYSGK